MLKRLGALFEQDCLLCASPSNRHILCAACEADLPWLETLRCPRCALPTSHGGLCGRCLSDPPYFDATGAVFGYDFPIDRLVQSFKYGHRLALVHYFGEKMAALPPPGRIDCLIPLPLHPARLRERGFNQALELAKIISKSWKIPAKAAICERVLNTPAQVGLPWNQRASNLRGAFRCASDIEGKHLMLIDDVMTTGASLNECARVLKQAGAARIDVLVLARALRH